MNVWIFKVTGMKICDECWAKVGQKAGGLCGGLLWVRVALANGTIWIGSGGKSRPHVAQCCTAGTRADLSHGIPAEGWHPRGRMASPRKDGACLRFEFSLEEPRAR